MISVVMPVYNGDKYLELAIDSILSQTYINFEFIIVNDGSSDNTSFILESYTNERICVYHTENQGIVSALNYAVSKSSNNIIVRMDCDDIAHKDRLKAIYDEFTKRKNLVLLGSNVNYIDSNGDVFDRSFYNYTPQRITNMIEESSNPFVHPSVAFNKRSFEACGGYKEVCPFEDIDLWKKLIGRGEAIILNKRLLDYRHNEFGIGGSFDSEGYSIAFNFYKYLYPFDRQEDYIFFKKIVERCKNTKPERNNSAYIRGSILHLIRYKFYILLSYLLGKKASFTIISKFN
jgi:glycosyltransferase involved in cell wall biosynthesis